MFDFEKKSLIAIKIDPKVNQHDTIISHLPPGVFTTFRTIDQKRAFQLSAHFLRLIESINLSNYRFNYSLDDLRPALLAVLKYQEGNEHKVRIQLPLTDLSICYIFVDKLNPYPEDFYTKGVKVKTNNLQRFNPKAKLSNFLSQSEEEKKFLLDNSLEESLILDENQNILEGLSSNFFGIQNKKIRTAEKNVLDGITRNIVLFEAKNLGVEINFQPVKLFEIQDLDEAFITSTSRKIMPIIKIDTLLIGDGLPGPITNQLRIAFDKRFLQEFEEI